MKTMIVAGSSPGGQIALTYRVENYPGIHDAITGPELVERLVTHATKFGAELDKREAKAVDFNKSPYKVTVGEEVVKARTVIIANGSINRKLGLKSEERLMGLGVFVCATCDAALYDGLRVVVVGGGDSALQEALDLAKFAGQVIIVHRRDSFTACRYLQSKVREESKINFMLNTEVDDILGDKYVEAVKLRDTLTGETRVLDTDGVLVAIGWLPNTKLYMGQIDLDSRGYVISKGVKTLKKGIFVAGDISDSVYRQVVTACSSGCKAALEAEWYLTHGE